MANSNKPRQRARRNGALAGLHTRAHHARYEIKVKGRLDARWVTWFDELEIVAQDDETTIVGDNIDQSKLRGIANKLWDLNLVLLSINRVEK